MIIFNDLMIWRIWKTKHTATCQVDEFFSFFKRLDYLYRGIFSGLQHFFKVANSDWIACYFFLNKCWKNLKNTFVTATLYFMQNMGFSLLEAYKWIEKDSFIRYKWRTQSCNGFSRLYGLARMKKLEFRVIFLKLKYS